MNQRLVESIAQIVLAMTEDERRLLEKKLQPSALQELTDLEKTDKTLRITEIARDIQMFEEQYYPPLSELPDDKWATPFAT